VKNSEIGEELQFSNCEPGKSYEMVERFKRMQTRFVDDARSERSSPLM
jgi:hypothetical protein